MLAVGDRVPEARVWLARRERFSLSEVVEDGPALFFFYLFEWAKSQ